MQQNRHLSLKNPPMFDRVFKALKGRARQIHDALLPPLCLLCGASGGCQPVCDDCLADLPALPDHHCPICLEATAYGETCGACLHHPPCFDQALALYHYAFPADRLIFELKHKARFALAQMWGHELARLAGHLESIGGNGSETLLKIDCVIPLPLHSERLAKRGYNQAQEIARHVARAMGIPCDIKSLHKHRATRPQSESSYKERRKNLKNAFVCMGDFTGQNILLVDDVLTTGATLNETARLLKQNGAKKVIAAVVCRTPKEGK